MSRATPIDMTKNPRMRGFTLPELMVTISLIAIASAFAFTTLIPYIDSYRVKGASFLVSMELQRARMEAVRSRQCVFFDRTSTVQFRIVRDNTAAPNCVLDGGDTVLRTINLATAYPGARFDQGSTDVDPFGSAVGGPSPTSVRFEPRGVVTTIGGSAVFLKSNNFGPLAVTVTAAGVVRTWRREGSTWK